MPEDGKLTFSHCENDRNNSVACLQVMVSLITLYPGFLINYILRREKVPLCSEPILSRVLSEVSYLHSASHHCISVLSLKLLPFWLF